MSEIYIHSSVGISRIVSRGGGEGTGDLLTGPLFGGSTNCSEFCKYLKEENYMDTANKTTSVVYYAHCYQLAANPLENNRRFAFPSQIGTTDLDPALPPMTADNISSCCMHFLDSSQ